MQIHRYLSNIHTIKHEQRKHSTVAVYREGSGRRERERVINSDRERQSGRETERSKSARERKYNDR